MIGYSPKLPLSRDSSEGLYGMNKTATESIKQDLKMLVLTNPGERMMNPDYGVGIKQILFELDTGDTSSFLIDRINQQVKNYMNFLEIIDLSVQTDTSNENSINVTIYYRVPYITGAQQLDINLVK